MTVEVVQESVRIFANVTEVDALTSTLKQQESVEVFEKRRVRLMNGTQNGLYKVSAIQDDENTQNVPDLPQPIYGGSEQC
jgi:hypothetical protein